MHNMHTYIHLNIYAYKNMYIFWYIYIYIYIYIYTSNVKYVTLTLVSFEWMEQCHDKVSTTLSFFPDWISNQPTKFLLISPYFFIFQSFNFASSFKTYSNKLLLIPLFQSCPSEAIATGYLCPWPLVRRLPNYFKKPLFFFPLFASAYSFCLY